MPDLDLDRPLISEGSQGAHVEALQTWLRDLGYGDLLGDYGPNGDGVDGHFGAATDRAVRAFQTDQQIAVDGMVGPQTWGALEVEVRAAGGPPADGGAPVDDPPDTGTDDDTVVAVPVINDPDGSPVEREYRVVWGDTLSGIALRFGTTVGALAAQNSIADPDRLREGQVLTVPGGTYTAPTSTPSLLAGARYDDADVAWLAIDFETSAQAEAVRAAVAGGGFVGMDPGEALRLGELMRQVQGLTDDIALELGAIEAVTGLRSALGFPIRDIGENVSGAGTVVIERANTVSGYQIAHTDTRVGLRSASLPGSGPTGSSNFGTSGPSLPILRPGATGTDVEQLQEALRLLGHSPGDVDGRFGPLTDAAVRSFQTSEQIPVDGIVGPITWTALRRALAGLPRDTGGPALSERIAVSSASQGGVARVGSAHGPDPRTGLGQMDPNGILTSPQVNPSLAAVVGLVLRDLAAQGYRPLVFEGFRSFERQNSLYAQGRTTAGNVVTGATAGRSFHNYGLAVDIIQQGPNGWREGPFWEALGLTAKRYGLVWGGDWRSPDRPHVELHPGLTASQAGRLLSIYREGGLAATWSHLGLDTAGRPVSTAPASLTGINPTMTLYLSDLTEWLQRNSDVYRQLVRLYSIPVGGSSLTTAQIELAAARRTIESGEADFPPGTVAQVDGSTWVYVVNRGDTLADIAAWFGVDWADIARQNGIDPDRIDVGQVLFIDGGRPRTGQGAADYAAIGIVEFDDVRRPPPPRPADYEELGINEFDTTINTDHEVWWPDLDPFRGDVGDLESRLGTVPYFNNNEYALGWAYEAVVGARRLIVDGGGLGMPLLPSEMIEFRKLRDDLVDQLGSPSVDRDTAEILRREVIVRYFDAIIGRFEVGFAAASAPIPILPTAMHALARRIDAIAGVTPDQVAERNRLIGDVAHGSEELAGVFRSAMLEGAGVDAATWLTLHANDEGVLSARYERLGILLAVDGTGVPQVTPQVLGLSSADFDRLVAERRSISTRLLQLEREANGLGDGDPLLDRLDPGARRALDDFVRSFESFAYVTESLLGLGLNSDGAGQVRWVTVLALADPDFWQTLERDGHYVAGEPAAGLSFEPQVFFREHHLSIAEVREQLGPDGEAELQRVARALLDHPQAFALLNVARDAAVLTGALDLDDLAVPADLTSVSLSDLEAFELAALVRPFLDRSRDRIDQANGGGRDENFTADDFRVWMNDPSNGVSEPVRELVNLAIEMGLVDLGGWERAQQVLEWAGVAVSIVALPVGGVSLHLTLLALALGMGEAFAAYQNDDNLGAGFALVGALFDGADLAKLVNGGAKAGLSGIDATRAGVDLVRATEALGSLSAGTRLDGVLGLVAAGFKALGSDNAAITELEELGALVRVMGEGSHARRFMDQVMSDGFVTPTERAVALAIFENEAAARLALAGMPPDEAALLVAGLARFQMGKSTVLASSRDTVQKAFEEGWLRPENLVRDEVDMWRLVRGLELGWNSEELQFLDMVALHRAKVRNATMSRTELRRRFEEGLRFDPTTSQWRRSATATVSNLREKALKVSPANDMVTGGNLKKHDSRTLLRFSTEPADPTNQQIEALGLAQVRRDLGVGLVQDDEVQMTVSLRNDLVLPDGTVLEAGYMFDARVDLISVGPMNRGFRVHEVKTTLSGGSASYTDGQRILYYALAQGHEVNAEITHGISEKLQRHLDTHEGGSRMTTLSAGEIHRFHGRRP